MWRIQLNLIAREPLILTDGSSETQAHQTLAYIPGNMILGALAGQWLRSFPPKGRPDDDPDFRALFLDGSVSWGHAYPVIKGEACLPIPVSFQRIKNQPGLPVFDRNQDHEKACVINALSWDGELADLKKISNLDRPKLKKYGAGFMHPKTFCQPHQPSQWNMHVALDQQKRSAAESHLFGFSALAPGNVFQSELLVDDKALPVLQQLLGKVKDSDFLVGHGRSAGYGAVGIIKEVKDAVEYKQPEIKKDGDNYTIFLLSDYLSAKSWQKPVESLLAELAPFLGRQTGILRLFGGHRLIAGFNNLWRLPRDSREALEKGSVIKFSTDGQTTRDIKELPPALGGGRVEGYGRIVINPEFLNDDVIKPEAVFAAEATKPAITISGASRPILKLMRQRALEREARRLAVEKLDDVKDFLTSAAKSPVSQSQRGNIRRLVTLENPQKWAPAFGQMLEKKTIKNKWSKESAQCPDTLAKGRKDHLDDIMTYLLSPKLVDDLRIIQDVKLPGDQAKTEAEQKEISHKFHRYFLLQLLSAWEKKARGNEKKGAAQ
ncbi:MAG: hypothetical protein LBP55_01830 [Candidatus Adiutrix sp.]|jgi:hypothetical protein|nr:hypothetical protein [Candidatus Adiutrix sp.]